jgi:hypothetical protein
MFRHGANGEEWWCVRRNLRDEPMQSYLQIQVVFFSSFSFFFVWKKCKSEEIQPALFLKREKNRSASVLSRI